MTRARVAVAFAAALSAVLLQATVVGPACYPWPVSLPAVLVAAVALMEGPATGMSFGFALGLLADLGSDHPAGVLALCWLGVGIVAGSIADRRTVRRDAVAAGLVCGLGAAATTLLLALVHREGSLPHAAAHLPGAMLGDALLALIVVPIVRRMLSAGTLRRPATGYPELLVDHRG